MAVERSEGQEQGKDRGGQGRLLVLGGCGVALVAVIIAMAAGVGSRLGLWHFRTGFALLTWAAYGGAAAACISLAGAAMALKNQQWKFLLLGVCGLVGGSVVVAVPLSWKVTARKVPPIHDITTDIDRPPEFVAILPLRKDAPNPASYGGAEVALKQREAYPDIRTVIHNAPPGEAFARALDTARAMGWRIVAEVPAEGRIEATDTTFWFGFTDDIVIRITPADHRSLVDIRSVSRVGRSDVGTNARRIREFVRKITQG